MSKFAALALTFCAIAQLPAIGQTLPSSFVSEPKTDVLKFVDSVQQSLRYYKNPLMTLNSVTQLQAGQTICIKADVGQSIEQIYNELDSDVAEASAREKELLTQWINIMVPASIIYLCPRHRQALDDYGDAIALKHPQIRQLRQDIDSIRQKYGIPATK